MIPASAWEPQDTFRGKGIIKPNFTQMEMWNLSGRIHSHSCLILVLPSWVSCLVLNSHPEGHGGENPRSSDALLHGALLLSSRWPKSTAGSLLFISVLCLPKCLHLSFSSAHLPRWFVLLHPSLSAANPSIHSPW